MKLHGVKVRKHQSNIAKCFEKHVTEPSVIGKTLRYVERRAPTQRTSSSVSI